MFIVGGEDTQVGGQSVGVGHVCYVYQQEHSTLPGTDHYPTLTVTTCAQIQTTFQPIYCWYFPHSVCAYQHTFTYHASLYYIPTTFAGHLLNFFSSRGFM